MNQFQKIQQPRGIGLLKALIFVCVAIEALLWLSDAGILPAGLRDTAFRYGAFWPGLLRDWNPLFSGQQATMFISYGFLHGGFLHLVFNMLALWSLGRVAIARLGPTGFVLLYGAACIGGGALFGMLEPDGRPMVGASGALFGLAGAIVLWLWRAQPTLQDSLRATWRIFAFLVLYNVVMFWALAGGLAWEAHLGGFLAGWLVAVFWSKR